MVDFLNNFSNSCTHRLYMFDRKINKIEAELRLLEIKLKSIPGFEEEKPKSSVDINVDNVDKQETNEPIEADEAANLVTEEKPEIDLAIAKYIKMVQFGVPVPAVKLKMQAEGLNPDLLKM